MLERIRGFIRHLELPQEEYEDVVYRIIDDDRNAIEVTATEYGRWRVQHDVAKLAVVGQDTVGDVLVRTTFSIMPESRGSKPFGTSAFLMPDYDPVTQYSHKYDTWLQADLGHRETVRLLTEEQDEATNTAQHTDTRAEETEVVLYAIASGVPGLFQVEASPDAGTFIRTPWLLPDGAPVQLTVDREGEGFSLSGPSIALPTDYQSSSEMLERVCEAFGVSLEGGIHTARAVDVLELPHAIASLAQAVACVSWMVQQP